MKIAIISPEVAPFSKAGGLGDVAHALPKHLFLQGHEVSVVTPYYRFIDEQVIQKDLVAEVDIPLAGKVYPTKFLRSVLSTATPLPVYFVYQPELFSQRDRIYSSPDDYLQFAFFDRSIFVLYEHLGFAPDVLHCHDWMAGLVPNFLKAEYGRTPFWSKTTTVFTIHNLPFQMHGMWFHLPQKKRDRGRGAPPTTEAGLRHTNFTLRGIKNADVINTVSERYAQEILTKKFGEGLDGVLRRRKEHVFGIINGIDYTVFNPSLDHYLNTHYDWNSLDKKLENKRQLQKKLGLPENTSIPIIGMAHRLTEQKGFNLLIDVLPILLHLNVQLVVVGHGEKNYLAYFRQMAKRYPEQIAVHLEFSEEVASWVYAGSDMFLMPSRYEPCGISQLISLRYGSIPIVHKTGGLADTISDFDPVTGVGTGFVFQTYSPKDLLVAMVRAIETYKYPKVWEHLTWQAMRQSFSWELPARKYVELYRRAIRMKHAVG